MHEKNIIDTNYSQRAREHHKRMLSHLQISSGSSPLNNASAAAPAAVVPLTPIDDKIHSSTSSSSLESSLQSPPLSATDLASMFGGNRLLDGQVYEPSYTPNTMQLDNHGPGKDMASDLYSFQPGLAYGHLYDTQSMPNASNTPRLQQKSEPSYGLSNGKYLSIPRFPSDLRGQHTSIKLRSNDESVWPHSQLFSTFSILVLESSIFNGIPHQRNQPRIPFDLTPSTQSARHGE